MSLIEPFTPEGVDPNNSYVLTCIDRVNTNYKAAVAAIPGVDLTLRPDLNTNIANTNTNTGNIATLIGNIATLTANTNTNTGNITTLTTKNNNSYTTINVKDYGAIGDNSNDDTIAINNAIAALPTANGILYIPQGTYKITNRLYIDNKINLMIKSDNALINTNFNGDTLYLNNCVRTNFNGDLTFNMTGNNGLNSNNAIVLNYSHWTTLKGIFIYGDFLNGIKLLTASGTGSTDTWPTMVTNCTIYGIHVNQVGNASIDNCSITNNNVGIYVLGLVNNNSDHGRISNNTINHNSCCNIYLSNIKWSWSIVNNQIWAALGPSTLLVATAVMARTGKFGIYAENCVNLNIIGNHIARNIQNIGLDGCQLTNISNNHIMGAIGITGVHIAYYGNTNTGVYGNSNSQTIITNNLHENALTSGFKFIYFHDNDTDRNIYIKGNRGTLTTPYNFFNTAGSIYYIDNCESYIIDANAIGLNAVNPSTDSPNSQSTQIIVMSHLLGEEVSINFMNITKWVWIRFKTDNTTTTMNIVGNGIGQHIPANKAIPINTSTCKSFKLIPINNNSNGWVIKSDY